RPRRRREPAGPVVVGTRVPGRRGATPPRARPVSQDGRVRAAVLPTEPAFVVEAVVAGGGEVVDVAEADVLVWTDPADAAGLAGVLAGHPRLRWVQLPWAGVEPYVEV